MSFLKYQKENPEFLNNYLKYKRYIEFCAETSVNETYFEEWSAIAFSEIECYRTKRKWLKFFLLVFIINTQADIVQSDKSL